MTGVAGFFSRGVRAVPGAAMPVSVSVAMSVAVAMPVPVPVVADAYEERLVPVGVTAELNALLVV